MERAGRFGDVKSWQSDGIMERGQNSHTRALAEHIRCPQVSQENSLKDLQLMGFAHICWQQFWPREPRAGRRQ